MSEQQRAETLELIALEDAELLHTLKAQGLHLKLEDARQLLDRLGRNPTAAELALIDSMWSEHCSYKSTRSLLRTLPTQAPNVVLGPGADAGIVRLPRVGPEGRARLEDAGRSGPTARCIAIAHESHNHPSQLLPYEGAATGIGGIVRDVYCMGADVIGVLDALRFGDPQGAQSDSVRQIVRGVVEGIAGYGNALGVPNLGGQVEFAADFDDNCLVNVVALGLLNEDELIPSRAPAQAGADGYVMMLVGKPTDDSGLGGAAFASGVLDTDEDTQERGAVQLPDPFFKRVLTEANKQAVAFLRQRGVAFAMKDLGAAGLGGASSEVAGELGLALDLDAVPADQPDRPAAVLMVAETQERYVLAIPADMAPELRRIYEEQYELGAMVRGAGARVIGRFTVDGRYRAWRQGHLHVDLPTQLITQPLEIEWPRRKRTRPERNRLRAREGLMSRNLEADLLAVLRSVGGASRHPVFGHYDCDVQGRTLLRPGDGDAGVVVPVREEPVAVAVAVAGPSRLGRRDAWRAGAGAVAEAARNVAAVGATPWALTDCLNFGSPENPEVMQDLEECVRGLSEAARTLGLRGSPGQPLPFVSGNVSLYNESLTGRAIPPTPIVSCLGVATDGSRCHNAALKQAGDLIYRMGEPGDVLGGSLYAEATAQLRLLTEDDLPQLDLVAERQMIHAVLEAFEAGLLSACHDVGDGGELLALLEMAFGRRGASRFGIRLELEPVDGSSLAGVLFSEATGFLCVLPPRNARPFEELCAAKGVALRRRGEVLSESELHLDAAKHSIRLRLADLAEAWRHGLDAVLREEVVA